MAKVRGIRVFIYPLGILFLVAVLPGTAQAARLGPSLAAKLAGLTNATSVGTVIVSFNTSSGLNASHTTLLTLAGVLRGYRLPNLGMVAAPLTAGQVRLLAGNPAVRSLWLNDHVRLLDEETRVLTGTDRMRDDPGFAALNHGLPVTGQGIGVLVNDSGIDATHPDLPFGSRVVQNVLSLLELTTVAGIPILPALEGLPNTDTSYGHGTHCAGIIAGSGAASGGRYSGVAPGAHLIGFGSGAALLILNSLGGFEYALANQSRYNIRVISNSWGSPGPFDPDNPIAIASKEAYDRGIVVVFAAGNAGPGPDTMSSDAKSPWVISVAAGTKEGGLAPFSSRGVPKAERPAGDFNAPTITAPGTGREFASSSGRFTADVVSARAKTNLFANGLLNGHDLELPLDSLSNYTQISGTSMAAPFIAGTVALMLSADPSLTPREVRAILTDTATQMPGYSEFETGAGYVNVYAAVDKVFNRSKPYGSYGGPLDLQPFRVPVSTTTVSETPFRIDFNPLALAGSSTNMLSFTVQDGVSSLTVSALADSMLMIGGNTVGFLLSSPDGTEYSSGLAIPILESPAREVSIANPAPGTWRLEVRGLRCLSALPEIALPLSGLALPGPLIGTITQRVVSLPVIADIQGDPLQAEIEYALQNRMIDVLNDGLFHPAATVTRGELARSLALNTALRQLLEDTPKYPDTPGDLGPIAEAVTAGGSTLRDYGFASSGMLAASPASFSPGAAVSRLDLAVALVRALGLDTAAQALAGASLTASFNGQTVSVSDEDGIPPALRGYVQIALDRGILSAYFDPAQLAALVEPDEPVTRATLAASIAQYRRAFATGN